LVSDIPAGDGKMANFFYSECRKSNAEVQNVNSKSLITASFLLFVVTFEKGSIKETIA
jgi:hypothetical protein